jgi:carbon-monoxide dehydrogenase medium subunit
VGSVKELNYIKKEDDEIRIGALTHLSAIEESELVREYAPCLVEAVGQMGSLQIRHQGTIGGNLCNASPAADTAPPLLILGAKALLKSEGRQRVVLLDRFFLGPGKTILDPGEIMAEIQIPVPEAEGRFGHEKLGRRNAFTLSIVSVAAWAKVEREIFQGIRIALGAVAPVPLRAWQTEKFLIGKKAIAENINAGMEMIIREVQPISDVRASADYRRDMSSVLTKRAILTCLRPSLSA